MARVPDRGDVVWVSMNPQTGREQVGRRPALVMSPGAYNGKVGLAILCPITSQGVILSDQAKSLDWKAREAEWICTLPGETVQEVLLKLATQPS